MKNFSGSRYLIVTIVAIFVAIFVTTTQLVSCASWRDADSTESSLDQFASAQKQKMSSASRYIEADFDFWAATLEPTRQDLADLRSAWEAHSQSFPESSSYKKVLQELEGPNKPDRNIVLVALFQTSYDTADLKNKTLGWSFYPVPSNIVELDENDVIIRTLMPVPNAWARYFLVRYANPPGWNGESFIVSNRTSRVDLKRITK